MSYPLNERQIVWCPQRDSNPQNSDFESDTYTNSITGANLGASDRTRTGTPLKARDFKSLAATNYATLANLILLQLIRSLP